MPAPYSGEPIDTTAKALVAPSALDLAIAGAALPAPAFPLSGPGPLLTALLNLSRTAATTAVVALPAPPAAAPPLPATPGPLFATAAAFNTSHPSFIPVELLWTYWQGRAGLFALYTYVLRDHALLGRLRLTPGTYRDLLLLAHLNRTNALYGPRSRANGYLRRYGYGVKAMRRPAAGVRANLKFPRVFHTFLAQAVKYYTESKLVEIFRPGGTPVYTPFDEGIFFRAGREILDLLKEHRYGYLDELTLVSRVHGLAAYRLFFDAHDALGVSLVTAAAPVPAVPPGQEMDNLLSFLSQRYLRRQINANAYRTLAEKGEFLLVLLRLLDPIWTAANSKLFLDSPTVQTAIAEYRTALKEIRRPGKRRVRRPSRRRPRARVRRRRSRSSYRLPPSRVVIS
jgi:hypothetical protein